MADRFPLIVDGSGTPAIKEIVSGDVLDLTGTTIKAVSVDTTLAVAGASTLTGNTTIGGTLGVTGAITGSLTGNASTATSAATLTTARTIGGTSFDGSANIAVALSTEATTLATPRAIAVAGDVTGTADFDGSAGISITTTLANDSIVTANITNANVTLAKMAANSIDSDQYVDGSIDTAHIGDDQVTGAKIENAVTIATSVTSPLVDAQNFKINGGQGSDGQVLTSTGSGVAWEDGGGGGVTFKTFGTASIMVGDDATGTISAANYNTALGVDVFAALTSGDYNSVLGFQAGYSLTTGEENTGVGYHAGKGITTGSYNTAVGSNSLVNTTTANYNTTLGRSAMHNNTTGAENTAVGSFALHQNTTASHNTAVGYFALEAHTTGSANTGVGRNCMPSLTTGNFNTGLGHGALGNMTTQSSCVAIGINALQTCLTGSGHNTALGADSGTVLTTGTHCTFVGSNSGIASGSSNNSVAACIFGADSKAQGSLANGLGYNLTCAAGFTTIGENANDIRAANGTATWATISDERVKKDITDSTAGLSFINDLRPRTFNFKAKGDLPKEFGGYEEGSTEAYKNDKTNHGFIAQEVKAVIDNHTEITDGFKMWDVRDTGQQEVAEAALIPMLVKAIQELSAEVQKLKGE